MNTEKSPFYLFASPTGILDESPATVFYQVASESVAKTLCTMFAKQYSDANGRPCFHYKAAESISVDEQVLLDESLGSLDLYDEPDPGVYEVPPSKSTLLRAEYSARALTWGEILVRKAREQLNANQTSVPTTKIPLRVIYVVADVLGTWYYSHTKLEILFGESGAPGEPPPGNCVKKCQDWLKRANADPDVDPVDVLGKVLVDFMSRDLHDNPPWQRGYERIKGALAECGLALHPEGRIIPAQAQKTPETERQDAMPTHQFNATRFRQLEEQLDIEYEKLHEFEKAISLADGLSQKIALRQQIKRDLVPRLRKLEREYAELLVSGVQAKQIPDVEAEQLVTELTAVVVEVEQGKHGSVPLEMVPLLAEILDKLNEPDKSASAKLKVSLPIIPLICSYELDLDTEGVVTQVWRKARDFFKRLLPRNPK